MIATRLLVMEGFEWSANKMQILQITLHLRDIAMATIFGFLYMGAHWRHLANTTEPSECSGDAALCQITLTTCY